jgi:hypothetical protein
MPDDRITVDAQALIRLLDAVADTVTGFTAYDAIKARGTSFLSVKHTTPAEEQAGYQRLQQALGDLRTAERHLLADLPVRPERHDTTGHDRGHT